MDDEETRVIPENLHAKIFDMARGLIVKNVPPTHDYSQQALLRGQTVAVALRLINILPKSYFADEKADEEFASIWTNVLEWARYLRHAITHIQENQCLPENERQNFSLSFTGGICSFVQSSNKSVQIGRAHV